jgi:hypothetical protein
MPQASRPADSGERESPCRRGSAWFGVLAIALCIWWRGASDINNALNRTFGVGRDPKSLDVYLYLAAISLSVAALPWWSYLPRHFSTRSMFLATTLVAIVLGLGVWLTR